MTNNHSVTLCAVSCYRNGQSIGQTKYGKQEQAGKIQNQNYLFNLSKCYLDWSWQNYAVSSFINNHTKIYRINR